MTMRTLIAFAASFVTVAVVNAAELPFRLATTTEVNELQNDGVIVTPINQINLSTAATQSVQKLSSAAVSTTQRRNNWPSEVYKAVVSSGSDPNPTPFSIDPANLPVLDFDKTHDSVQAWGRMSESGAPLLFINASGKSKGQSAASWSTQYVVTGSGSRDVYAQFTVPVMEFQGRFSDSAPSSSWGRMRIDFLVNAYPAWSTEALRFNEVYDVIIVQGTSQITKKRDRVRIDTFGSGLSFTVGADPEYAYTTAKTVTIKLGNYLAGTVLDVTQLFLAESKLDSQCVPEYTDGHYVYEDNIQIDYCSGLSVKINWDQAATPPTFYSKPTTP
jgi:hypothetical protein